MTPKARAIEALEKSLERERMDGSPANCRATDKALSALRSEESAPAHSELVEAGEAILSNLNDFVREYGKQGDHAYLDHLDQEWRKAKSTTKYPWISVSDRTPNEFDRVLGMTNNGKLVVVFYSTREWNDEYHLVRDIVKWTPLPPTPDE